MTLSVLNRKSFYILFAMIALAGLFIPSNTFADVLAPKKQVNFGISSDKIFCKGNMFKVFKAVSGEAFCAKPASVKKLHDNGVISTYDAAKIKQLTDAISNKNTNKITIQAIIKQTVVPPKTTSLPGVDSYHTVFEICAGNSPIRSPEIILTSESESKFEKLTKQIPSNQCQTNAVKIKASNPDSIKIELVNKGRITEKLTQLENKVSDLQTQIQDVKKFMVARLAEFENPEDYVPDPKRVTKLVDLREELKSAKEELNRYQFSLNMIPKITPKEVQVSKSFSGDVIEDTTLNKLAVKESTVTKGVFDVIFEMCAGVDPVRVPTVVVSSEMETKTIKLAERIVANSCQVSGTKINATSSDNIELSIGDTNENSVIVQELEKQLSDLNANMQVQHDLLRDITHANPRPADFQEQAIEISDNISDLRSQILKVKVQLYKTLNQIYK